MPPNGISATLKSEKNLKGRGVPLPFTASRSAGHNIGAPDEYAPAGTQSQSYATVTGSPNFKVFISLSLMSIYASLLLL